MTTRFNEEADMGDVLEEVVVIDEVETVVDAAADQLGGRRCRRGR